MSFRRSHKKRVKFVVNIRRRNILRAARYVLFHAFTRADDQWMFSQLVHLLDDNFVGQLDGVGHRTDFPATAVNEFI